MAEMTRAERIEELRKWMSDEVMGDLHGDCLDDHGNNAYPGMNMALTKLNELVPINLPDEPAVLEKGEVLCIAQLNEATDKWEVTTPADPFGSWPAFPERIYAAVWEEVCLELRAVACDSKEQAEKAILKAGGRLLVRRRPEPAEGRREKT